MLSLKLFLHRLHLNEKLCYAVIFGASILVFLLGFGPFLTIQPPVGGGQTFNGYDFLTATKVGDFAPFAILGIIYNSLILLLSFTALIRAKPRNDASFFWALTVIFLLGFLSYGTVLNYYAINLSIFSTNDYQTHVLWAGILYDIALWLFWPAFFYLHHRGYGQKRSAPSFGTGLDDETVKK